MIDTALKGFGNANGLPGILIIVFRHLNITGKISLQIIHMDLLRCFRRSRLHQLHFLICIFHTDILRQYHQRTALHGFFTDLGQIFVDFVLLVTDKINIAVTEEFAVNGHILAQNQRKNIWLIKRDPGFHQFCRHPRFHLRHSHRVQLYIKNGQPIAVYFLFFYGIAKLI